MSDAGNLGFRSPDGIVWLYTHWHGDALEDLAEAAIAAAKPRWYDPPYATRIALTHLIGRTEGDTGWGIDAVPGMNDHPALVIDWTKRETVAIDTENIARWDDLDERRRDVILQHSPRRPFPQ